MRAFPAFLQWTAITCIVVSAPVIGKSARISCERVVGTLSGGWLAFGFFEASSNGAFLAVMAGATTLVAVVLGCLLNMDYAAKLFVATFLIGGHGAGSQHLACPALVGRGIEDPVNGWQVGSRSPVLHARTKCILLVSVMRALRAHASRTMRPAHV
jgi:hypothetical protein